MRLLLTGHPCLHGPMRLHTLACLQVKHAVDDTKTKVEDVASAADTKGHEAKVKGERGLQRAGEKVRVFVFLRCDGPPPLCQHLPRPSSARHQHDVVALLVAHHAQPPMPANAPPSC